MRRHAIKHCFQGEGPIRRPVDASKPKLKEGEEAKPNRNPKAAMRRASRMAVAGTKAFGLNMKSSFEAHASLRAMKAKLSKATKKT